MFLCICNAIRTSDFERAALACPGDAESIYAALGKVPQCRQCLDEAEDKLEALRLSRRLPALA